MVPPIKWSFEVEIKTDKQADSIVEDLNEQERKRLLDALNKKMWIKHEITEKKEHNHEYLLNKPNMTAKDKEWMKKSIDYLVEKKMDTSENLKKLDAIVYTPESIEIWGVKRARKDISAKPNGKNIFQHNNVTYFKRSEEMIKEQNKILAQQGMEIPLDGTYETSMKALPGEYSKTNRYEWWNILALITDMSMGGYCTSGGELSNFGTCGYRWSAFSRDYNNVRSFGFNEGEGRFRRFHRYNALPFRPVLK